MVGLNPGKFRELVTFIKLIRESDSGGGFTKTEEQAFQTKASVDSLKSLRTFEDLKLGMTESYSLTIRRNPDKIPEIDMIVEWRSKRFLVKYIQEVDVYNRWLNLIIIRE